MTVKVDEILKSWETEMKEEIENEIEYCVATAITEFTNNTKDQCLTNIIARQSVVINKLLDKQMANTMNQIDLMDKIKELYGKIMETESNVKELADQTALMNSILSGANLVNA